MSTAATPEWTTVTVIAKKREAQDIVSFELARPDGAPLPAFSAGSHIDVEVRSDLVRQYSLCHAPGTLHRYRIAVLREPASRGGSVAMHEDVEIGDALRISAPRNHFALEPTTGRVLLLAGGIGITPLLCMAERLAESDARFELHYATRSRSRCAFLEELRAARFGCRAHFYFDDERRLDLERILRDVGPTDHLYVCGPKGLIDAALSCARFLGWRDEQLHREFFVAAREIERSGDEVFEIEIASTGRRYAVAPGQRVVDVLDANGIVLPRSCEQGVCGTCLTRVLRGMPDHRDSYLTDREHSANDQFTPCCSRSKSKLLILDL